VKQVANNVEILARSIERNRWLQLRTRRIGVLEVSYLKEHDVSGPVLWASEQGQGDVQSRLLTRLHHAVSDMRTAIDIITQQPPLATHTINWDVPVGEAHATVEGPRGTIGIQVKSDGGEKPAYVAWQSPSATWLPLLPEMLPGQILADAEIILASLDLAIAEADG
jgi:NADH:ubiquinone oxidoreductase subunit D